MSSELQQQQQQQSRAPNVTASSSGSSNPTESATAEPNSSSSIEDRLDYLREHRICERLELMVRGLITTRPADPVLALCASLKEADRALGFLPPPSSALEDGVAATNNNGGSGSSDANRNPAMAAKTGATTTTTTRQGSGNPALLLRKNSPTASGGANQLASPTNNNNNGGNNPGSASVPLMRSVALSSSPSQTSLPATPLSSSPYGNLNAPQWTATTTANASASLVPRLATANNNSGSGMSGASLPPLAVRMGGGGATTATTAQVSSGRVPSATPSSLGTGRGAQQQQQAPLGSARSQSGGIGGLGGSAVGLDYLSAGGHNHVGNADRDESARSDLSLWSVQSVDMGEFLSEFRAAHHAIFGAGNTSASSSSSSLFRPRITFQDLADIVDRVAVPLPDTNMLAALFCEMESTSPTAGQVVFEGFLSRMAHRIQGRFTSENLAGLFVQLATSAQPQPQQQSQPQSQQGSLSAPSSARPASSAVSGASAHVIESAIQQHQRSIGSAQAQNHSQSSSSVNSPISATTHQQQHPQHSAFATSPRPSSSAAAGASADTTLVAHTAWVSARVCIEQGMEALGLRREDIPLLMSLTASSSPTAATMTATATNVAASATATTGPSWSIHDFLKVANSAVSGFNHQQQQQQGGYPMQPPGSAGSQSGVTAHLQQQQQQQPGFWRAGGVSGSVSNLGSYADLTAIVHD